MKNGRAWGDLLRQTVGAFLLLATLGCAPHRELWSLLSMRAPDSIEYSKEGAALVAPFLAQRWPPGTRYEVIASDILNTHPVVEAPDTWAWRWAPSVRSDQARPAREWTVRFGPDYIEAISARYAWYGSWWFTIYLRFKDGELIESFVHAEDCCL